MIPTRIHGIIDYVFGIIAIAAPFVLGFADGTAAIVSFAQKGATVADLGLRGATHVAWGDGLVFGFKDGHAESGDRHAPPSERPAVART